MSAGLALPQLGHFEPAPNAAPHSQQNFTPSGFSLPHDEHFTVARSQSTCSQTKTMVREDRGAVNETRDERSLSGTLCLRSVRLPLGMLREKTVFPRERCR